MSAKWNGGRHQPGRFSHTNHEGVSLTKITELHRNLPSTIQPSPHLPIHARPGTINARRRKHRLKFRLNHNINLIRQHSHKHSHIKRRPLPQQRRHSRNSRRLRRLRRHPSRTVLRPRPQPRLQTMDVLGRRTHGADSPLGHVQQHGRKHVQREK